MKRECIQRKIHGIIAKNVKLFPETTVESGDKINNRYIL